MSDHTVAIIGLPASGKTTFLAALWHLLNESDDPTRLQLKELGRGELGHLNRIAARWRDAKQQDRTATSGNHFISMKLAGSGGAVADVMFPDTAGEAYRDMWETRQCDKDVAGPLAESNVMLLVNAETIRAPLWLLDVRALSESMGLPVPAAGEPVPFHPRHSPTQVPLVEILQFLQEVPLGGAPRKLAIMLTAWDKAKLEEKTPEDFLAEKLPFLAQYLSANRTRWDWRVYGVSCQGGEYDDPDKPNEKSEEAKALRELDKPSRRIELAFGSKSDNDITEPIEWLMT